MRIFNNISRKIYKEIIGDAEALKAIALMLYVKNLFPTSVITNYTDHKLAKITGIHQTTVKKRMSTLADMDLIEYANKKFTHIVFKSIRSKQSKRNIRLSKIDFSSVKSIELGLKAMFICEVQRRKDYIEQQVVKANNPVIKKGDKNGYRAFKRARKFCTLRGISSYSDNGISYKYIANKLNISIASVAKMIKHGEGIGLFNKTNHVSLYATVKGMAKHFVSTIGENNLFCTLRNNNVYAVSANTYKILS